MPFAAGPFAGVASGAGACLGWLSQSKRLSASANFVWSLIDSGWAEPMPCAKSRSAAKVWSSNWRLEVCDVLAAPGLGPAAPICCAKDVSVENAKSSAICPRGGLDSCVLASCDQFGSVELMPATVKAPSALAD